MRWRWVVELLLLLLQEINNKLLILLNEVVRQSLVLEVLAKVFAPQGVKSVEQSKLGLRLGAVHRVHDVMLDRVCGRRCSRTRRLRRRRGRRVSMTKETAQQAVLVCWLAATTKGRRPCGSACVLLSFVHLLLELLSLLLIHEAQPCETFFQLEGVKEGTVLIIVPGVEDLLIPDDSTVRRL